MKLPCRSRCLGVAMLLAAVLARPGACAAGSFATDPLWSDGKAEFSLYTGHAVSPGGANLPLTARIIVVKEEFDRKLLVKSDADPSPRVNFTVLKQNVIVDIPSGVYTTHLMTSSFLDTRTWKLVKLTASSAEACGITYVEVKSGPRLWLQHSYSYFDGEGDRDLRLSAGPAAQALDALPLWLRGQDLSRSVALTMDLLPDQAHGRVKGTSLVPAVAQVAEAESLTVPAGTYLARRVEVRYGDHVDVLQFDAAFPHVLLRAESHSGTVLELAKTLRLDYWNKAHPGDEKILGTTP